MSELDPLWTAYLHLQSQSRNCRRMDAAGWGLEAGLNHVLAKRDHGNAAAAAERGTARERHRARLRLRYFDVHQVDDPGTRLDEQERLRNLLRGAGRDDRRILLAIGFGHDSATVACIMSKRPDAIRQKLARLRAKVASSC